MKRKIVTALICAATVGTVVTGCGAKKPEAKVNTKTEAVTGSEGTDVTMSSETDTESVSETGTLDEQTEMGTEEAAADIPDIMTETEVGGTEEGVNQVAEKEPVDYPDYKALDYVELGEYNKLDVKEPEGKEITDDDVERRIKDNLMENFAEFEKTGEIKDGDTVKIDYVGKINGKEFDGGSAEDYELEIGSGYFVDGFEEQLVGSKVGDTVDVKITFPEDYREGLAGKDAEFSVKITAKKVTPELTDDMVKDITDGEMESVKDYEEFIRLSLESEARDALETEKEEILMDAIKGVGTIKEIPEELMSYYEASIIESYKDYAAMFGMDYEDFISEYMDLSLEDLEDSIQANAADDLALEMVLQAVCEKEGIELSEEEALEGESKYQERYGYETKEDMFQDYTDNTIKHMTLMDKGLEFMKGKVVWK